MQSPYGDSATGTLRNEENRKARHVSASEPAINRKISP